MHALVSNPVQNDSLQWTQKGLAPVTSLWQVGQRFIPAGNGSAGFLVVATPGLVVASGFRPWTDDLGTG